MALNEQAGSNRTRGASLAAFALLSLLLLGVGAARAQQGAPPSESPASSEGADEGSSLSPEQMLTQSRETVAELENGAKTMGRQLREAREDRDVVKALCLEDKLTQLDVARRSAVDRVAGLEGAVQGGHGERTRHEFAVLTALRERGQALVAEASQCIGEETGAIGDARVVVTVDPEIAATDPTFPDELMLSIPPVFASPTL